MNITMLKHTPNLDQPGYFARFFCHQNMPKSAAPRVLMDIFTWLQQFLAKYGHIQMWTHSLFH